MKIEYGVQFVRYYEPRFQIVQEPDTWRKRVRRARPIVVRWVVMSAVFVVGFCLQPQIFAGLAGICLGIAVADWLVG